MVTRKSLQVQRLPVRDCVGDTVAMKSIVLIHGIVRSRNKVRVAAVMGAGSRRSYILNTRDHLNMTEPHYRRLGSIVVRGCYCTSACLAIRCFFGTEPAGLVILAESGNPNLTPNVLDLFCVRSVAEEVPKEDATGGRGRSDDVAAGCLRLRRAWTNENEIK